ncbi:hypothetical protein [Jiella sonneratiae]|uniref:DUF1176 domain-containing protein n=1 Tax=Jiella sonneratiae TaxID=2816856 RepID=A0ABS3J0R1_9HYPH|nr:hypothetical protein [Jiella sonneratiae]MBO0903245.1 hypothetical protein [Jiella sonneratiae]
MKTIRLALLIGGIAAAGAGASPPALALDEALQPAAAGAGQAEAPAPDDYTDDRSNAEALIRSLYNAIDRHEYLRAWSYFADDSGRPDFPAFEKGYETTAGVRLKLGEPTSDGAAGSIYTAVPTVIEATGTDGAVRVFSGCYVTRLVQPANQATPPFLPLQISKATLRPARTKFDETSGDCPDGGD